MRNKLAKNSIAVGLVTLIVTAGLSFSAQGAPGDVAQSEASAITATGLTDIVDSDVCTASSPTGTPVPEGTGTCGVGLGVSGPAVGLITQTASTSLSGSDGVSTAKAEVASVGLDALTTIDLSNLESEVGDIDTGTILDDVVTALGPVTGPLFELLLTPLTTALQDNVISPLLTSLQAALPVSVEVGAVSSTCDAVGTAAPTSSVSVAGIDILVDLPGDNDVIVPIDVSDLSPNAALVGSIAPQEIVNALLDGVEGTLNASLATTLGPLLTGLLVPLLGTIQEQLLDGLLDVIGTALLDPVGEAISPILDGTVNKQVVGGDGSLETTALSLNVLSGTATLDIARTKCGPNGVVAADDEDTQADGTVADGTVADGTVADGTVADADNNDADNNDADAAADADNQADADVTTTLPATGSPNLLPFWMLGLGLLLFGATVLLNEKRRLQV